MSEFEIPTAATDKTIRTGFSWFCRLDEADTRYMKDDRQLLLYVVAKVARLDALEDFE